MAGSWQDVGDVDDGAGGPGADQLVHMPASGHTCPPYHSPSGANSGIGRDTAGVGQACGRQLLGQLCIDDLCSGMGGGVGWVGGWVRVGVAWRRRRRRCAGDPQTSQQQAGGGRQPISLHQPQRTWRVHDCTAASAAAHQPTSPPA